MTILKFTERQFVFSLTILLAGLLSSGCAVNMLEGPKFDPSLTWHVLKTPHFRVYFHQGEDTQARKTARFAEEAHAILVPKIGWEPAEPTHIVLADNQDAVSGSATPFPNNTIYLSLTSPLESPVPFWVRYDDWLREVITHEYVHILHLDTNGGFPSVSRALFGRSPFPLLVFNGAFPNLLQPDWLIEGLATYEETATGVSDRRDNAYAEMLLRMAVLEDRFPTLDQAGGRDTWPAHQIEYLFGARFYDYLARRFGEGALKELSREYSNNVIPFFVGTTGRQVLGQSYDSLWESWKGELKVKYRKEREGLERLGITESRPITHLGDYVLGPRSNPVDGRIVYTHITPHEYPALRMTDPATGQDDFLVRRNVGFTASWSPDGKTLAFSQLEVHRNYSQYSDVYLYDLPNRALQRLTRGARLRDPDFHPDGTRLICVENGVGKNRLIILDRAGRKERLDWLEDDLIFWHPRWSPDGKFVAVSVWKNGEQGIYLIDIENRKFFPLLMDRALDMMPTWSPDGRHLIFFSDRTGIYNLFAYRVETKEFFRITNLLGGAFTPEVTRDGKEIFFASYGSRGFDLHRVAWVPADWKQMSIPVPSRGEESGSDELTASIDPEPYSPWSTARPRFWTPILGSDESGLQIGGATGGMDVLGRHKFNAAALYGTETHRSAYSLQYLNDSFYPTLRAGFSDLAAGYADLWDIPNAEYSYWERRQRLDLDVTLARFAFQIQQFLTLGYRTEWLSALSGVPSGAEPPGEGRLSGLRVSWRLGTAREYGFSISREEGRLLQASYIHFDHQLGSDFDQNRYVVAWHEYPELFRRHHVLGVRLTGGVATGDRMVQRAFQVGGPTLAEAFLDPDQTEFSLRGYPAGLLRGQKAAAGTVEYRIPLYNVERGVGTWPFFLQRVHAALFYDVGNAWDDHTILSDFRGGIGSEIKTDMVFGHRLPLRLRLGFAEGLDEGGEKQIYFTVGDSF